MSASESTPGDELGELRRRVLDLQTAYETARRSEAAMSLAIAGLRRRFNEPLSVLVPLVDLMLLEAEDRLLPLAVLADLATLKRNLERLCRAAAVASVDEPDREGLFDLNVVLRETIALVTDPFAQRDVRVHMALDAQIPPIRGNPVALGHLLMSFLTSAHDTVGAGGVIWVETASTDPPAGARLVVRLVARDDGNGAPDTVPATSGKPLLAIEPESTGLEFSIIRGIVESHGGTLELRSHASVGKTWIVLLPGRNGHQADR
jgi:signal transduction histidine kinase